MESILNEILADNVISNHELSAYSDKYSCLHCRRLQGRTARGDSNSILNSEDAVLRKSKVDLEGSFDSGISELGRRIKIARNFYAEYSITSQRIYILENDLYRGGKVEEIFPGSDMFHGKGFLHSFKYISRYREAYQKALASNQITRKWAPFTPQERANLTKKLSYNREVLKAISDVLYAREQNKVNAWRQKNCQSTNPAIQYVCKIVPVFWS